jgi:hypothetical protein
MVEAVGGRIEVISQAGSGSTFIVLLPVAPEPLLAALPTASGALTEAPGSRRVPSNPDTHTVPVAKPAAIKPA